METLATHREGHAVRSKFSISATTGANTVTFMIKPFLHGDEWFRALLVHDLSSDGLMGTVAKITHREFVLKHSKECQPGNKYQFRLALPSDVLGHTQILFEAICTDSHKQTAGSYFNNFSSLVADPGNMDVIEMLIMIFAIKSLN